MASTGLKGSGALTMICQRSGFVTAQTALTSPALRTRSIVKERLLCVLSGPLSVLVCRWWLRPSLLVKGDGANREFNVLVRACLLVRVPFARICMLCICTHNERLCSSFHAHKTRPCASRS